MTASGWTFKEFAYDFGESLTETVSVNLDTEQNTETLALEFEQEMQKLLDPVRSRVNKQQVNTQNNVFNNTSTSYVFDNMIIW